MTHVGMPQTGAAYLPMWCLIIWQLNLGKSASKGLLIRTREN